MGSDDAVARHDRDLGHALLCGCRRVARSTAGPGYSSADAVSHRGPLTLDRLSMAAPFYIGMALLNVLFFFSLQRILHQPAGKFSSTP